MAGAEMMDFCYYRGGDGDTKAQRSCWGPGRASGWASGNGLWGSRNYLLGPRQGLDQFWTRRQCPVKVSMSLPLPLLLISPNPHSQAPFWKVGCVGYSPAALGTPQLAPDSGGVATSPWEAWRPPKGGHHTRGGVACTLAGEPQGQVTASRAMVPPLLVLPQQACVWSLGVSTGPDPFSTGRGVTRRICSLPQTHWGHARGRMPLCIGSGAGGGALGGPQASTWEGSMPSGQGCLQARCWAGPGLLPPCSQATAPDLQPFL